MNLASKAYQLALRTISSAPAASNITSSMIVVTNAASAAYRVALVGRYDSGKRTAQQHLVEQWGACSFTIPEEDGVQRPDKVSEAMLASAGANSPLLVMTCKYRGQWK